MEKSLVANGFVIINNGLDLSKINTYWLVKNGILTEDELSGDHVFTSNLVIINLNKITITINSNSIILGIRNNYNEQDFEFGVNKLILLLQFLKNTLNLSCGINFNWILDDLKAGEYIDISKRLFYVPGNDLYDEFNEGTPCFGAYMSKEFRDSRLKLDIKPIFNPISNDINDGTLQFNFNFHRDLVDSNSIEEISNYFNDWKTYKDESEKLVSKI